MSQHILITGASSGFGKLTVDNLLSNGHTVIASMRGISGKNAAAAESLKAAGAHIVEIDVTQEESTQAGVAAALEATGHIDVVVNNAGVGVLGLQESFTPEDWQRVFDINVFGVQRVNRAVLPHMRERGKGLLIHVTSILGRMTLPFYGPYNASKWALEALAENYRTELSSFGIGTCIVEPGGYPTQFHENLIRPGDTARNAAYGDLAAVPEQAFAKFQETLAANPEQNPRDVANAIADLIEMPPAQRPFRTVVDKMGMGDHFAGYNAQLAQITAAIYHAFGMGDMLELKISN
ncbi:MAG: SDR family NAD(P)-dependent oxidoreductase [Desulfosarcinaceae bacterium]|nr:SDR family NAD(P)-dependent oxidoreductase [Desulfosarcinaceae bacterium]